MKGQTHTIKYRYVCEQCGKQTDWISSNIEEETETSGALELVSSIVDKDRFKKQLEKFKEKIESGKYDYHFQDGSACPFCGKHQSWLPVAGTVFSPAARIALYMCGWLFIGLIFVIGVPILQRETNLLEWLPYESWIVFLFVPPLIGLFLAVRRNHRDADKNQAQQAATTIRNKPEIDWNGI